MIKLGGLQLDQAGCSCAAICNKQKAKANEVGWWRLLGFVEPSCVWLRLIMIKLGGLQLDQIGCSCAAIYNKQKAKADELGWWRLVV